MEPERKIPSEDPARHATVSKAFLICPAERAEVSALCEQEPLVNLRILGKPFIHHWLEHLAARGAIEVAILAADRPERVRQAVGDGSRWGLRVEIIPQSQELNCAEVRSKFFPVSKTPNLLGRPETILIDHFPGLPQLKLFSSHAAFFEAIQKIFSEKTLKPAFGLKESRPGIWTGFRTHIAPDVKLNPPCWIGDDVILKAGAEIGPQAFLENGVVIEANASVEQSWIGPMTFAGNLTQIKNSLAIGDLLVNHQTESVARIPDEFLLCALADKSSVSRPGNLFGRIFAFAVFVLTLPLTLITFGRAWYSRQPALRLRRACAPRGMGGKSVVTYYEFANANGWWRRWPQLWNVVRGEFAWIGNRPLTPIEAGDLKSEFERLWLDAPIGLISQGDAEGCSSLHSDEARAHASYYSASASWRLDVKIFCRALKRLIKKELATQPSPESTAFKQTRFPLAAKLR